MLHTEFGPYEFERSLPIIDCILVVCNTEYQCDRGGELGPHELDAPDEGRSVAKLYGDGAGGHVPAR